MTGEQEASQMTLEQIEGDVWGDPPPDPTALVARVHRLRQVPIASLDADALRVLVAQQIGLPTVMPLVLAHLEADPMLEANFYPGDLLVAVLKLPAAYWSAHPAQRPIIERLADGITEADAELRADIEAFRAAP